MRRRRFIHGVSIALACTAVPAAAAAEPPMAVQVGHAAKAEAPTARDKAAGAGTGAAVQPAPGRPQPPVRGVHKPARRDKSWVQTSSGDRIVTFKREVPGSDVIALRGEGVVDAPVTKVASVLLDYTRATEWIDSLEEVRIVRMLGPLEFVEYDHVGTPPIIMKDRDFVCRGKLSLDLAEQSLVMTIEPTTDPRLPPTSYIRGELHGYWKLKAIDGGRRTSVITEMHGDPKGSVAKWLVNLFQKGWARSTIESLREQVAKPDIKVMPQVKAAFEGKPIEIAIKSK